ncbi:MAG: hypothetical protein ACXWDF_10730 [Aeromicrobium sp.]
MPEKFVRVTDKDTGHKRTIRESQLAHGNYTVLKADAVDAVGNPLPPEYGAVKPLSNNNTDGQTANDTKEK